jgi:hypothetical protein
MCLLIENQIHKARVFCGSFKSTVGVAKTIALNKTVIDEFEGFGRNRL